ncbi:MAG: hypothetical protein KF754_03425 [Planctomycetes bacterium]|nr:hypothetical protein [Planctomycetota bacterium]
MNISRHIPVALALVLVAGSLHAAKGGIDLRDGKSQEAFAIDKETISGIEWQREQRQPGARIELWDVIQVRYSVTGMDEFNGMARKLAGGNGTKMVADANSFLSGAAPAGLNADEWERVQHACRYYLAAGLALQGQHDQAVAKYIEYLKKCEEKPAPGGIRARFRSVVGGKDIAEAGGLHRLYLDGLTGLGMSYLALKDTTKANDQAFKPLIELCASLAGSSGKSQYYDWSLRALRALADHSENAKDYKSAREAYDQMARTALQKEGGRPSRASNEAQLKVGFMQIREGDLSGARAKFFEAIRAWEGGHDITNAAPPRNNWINPDVAYLTAGSYLGQGMVDAARAKSIPEWSVALSNFSTALSVFRADDEIRSMALLGAANAASTLAELNGQKADVANNYARLAEKYQSELLQQLPKSKAASDEKLVEIEKRITKFKLAE